MPDRPADPSAPDPFWWRDTPARPRPVDGGIRIHSARGAVAQTWWSQRFLTVLEALGVGGRLARGRSYARAGQIVDLDVAPGAVTAQVQGSATRPYRVRLGVPAFGKAEWSVVLDELAADASYAAELLAGQLPRHIEEVFERVGLSLLPRDPDDLVMDCSCPDRSVPCKHLAAVCYLLAERFDADPFTVLALRGRDRDAVLDALRERRTAPPLRAGPGRRPGTGSAADVGGAGPAPPDAATDPDGPGHGSAGPLPADPARFWAAPPLPRPVRGAAVPPDALLDQVPPLPLAVRGVPVTELLRPLYRAMPAGEPPPEHPDRR